MCYNHFMENLESSKEQIPKEVVNKEWIKDERHNIHLKPGTAYGQILGPGSTHDFRVKFEGVPYVQEVNANEVEEV